MSIRRFIAAGSGGRYTWPCFDLLARQGVYVVCAGVTLPNKASVGLHESLGFTAVGVYRDVSWKFGAWHDVGWWQMPLRDPNPDGPAELAPPARLKDTLGDTSTGP